jgi:hypothetical protein
MVAEAQAPALPEADDDSLPWQALGDTDSYTARGDTAPHSGSRRFQLATGDARRRRLIILISAGVGVLGLAIVLWAILRSGGGDSAGGRPVLDVSKDPAQGRYRSIREALGNAKPGDVIELVDEQHVESLVIDPSRATKITIQAKPGTQVVWSPSVKDPAQPLLFLSGAHGFRLNGKGITLDGTIDGKNKLETLVSIQLHAPGLVLEGAELRGFAKRGVQIMNAWGEKGNPLRLVNLSIAGDNAEAGIYFDANPKVNPPYNDFVDIDASCRISGFSDDRSIARKDNTVNGSNVKRPGAWK